MSKKLRLAVFFGLLVLACNKKPSYDDLSGSSYIAGTVVLYDTLTGPYGYVNVHPITVYLRYANDSTTFLYSTTTNSAGQYTFTGISPNQAYVAYAYYDSANLQFIGQFTYPVNDTAVYHTDTLKLNPAQSNQNGMFFQLRDSATGDPLPGCKVFIFSSRTLWANDDSLGNVYSLVSDNFGRCLQLNVVPGKYWIHAKGTFHNLTLQTSDSIVVDTQGITNPAKVLRLAPAPAAYGTGFQLYLTDSNNLPLSNATVYVFNSRVLWGNSDSTGNVFTLQTDGRGLCIAQNIIAGEYYYHAQWLGNGIVLQASDSVKVAAQPPGVLGSLVVDTITLVTAPAAYGTGMLYYLQDTLNDPLGNSTLYVFNSKVLWGASDSIGSVFKIQSNYAGKCLLQNILPGEYYVHANGNFVVSTGDTLRLYAADSVLVTYDSLSIRYLQLHTQ